MTARKKVKDIFNMTAIRDLMDGLNRPIAFRRALVDLTGSVQAALMLSQAIYWQERVTREDGWWYKSIEEWQEETGLSRYQQDTARKKCRKYLHSKLRDIPARLYWKVDRQVLKDDLCRLNPRLSQPVASESCSEKTLTSLGDSSQQAGAFSPSINMYTEITTENDETERTEEGAGGEIDYEIHPIDGASIPH